MKYFIKIVGSVLLSSLVTTSLFSKEECVTKEEVYEIINKVLEDKKNSYFLEQKIMENKTKKNFENKLKSKSFNENFDYYQTRINKLSILHQEVYCSYMNKVSIDSDLNKRKKIIILCSKLYEDFNIDKSIEYYLDLYYNFENNNNLEILNKLKDLYLKQGDMEKYNHIKNILK